MNLNDIFRVEFTPSADWKVTWNEFFEVDPDSAHSIQGFDEGYTVWDCFFSEDLLQIENAAASDLIDVGWYPSKDPHGCYIGRMLRREGASARYDWDSPVRLIETRNPKAITAFVNECLEMH